jgi:hypothetical protein
MIVSSVSPRISKPFLRQTDRIFLSALFFRRTRKILKDLSIFVEGLLLIYILFVDIH